MSTIKAENIAKGANSTDMDNAIFGTAKAWVNFDGTGTVAIRRSYNTSSITDTGTGNYTVNFTTAFADNEYAALTQAGSGTTTNYWAMGADATPAAGSYYFHVGSGGADTDLAYVTAAFFY
jgi:hypothetical protein